MKALLKTIKSVKAFLKMQKFIDATLNFFIIRIVIQIPAEHDWFNIDFSFLQFFHFYASACYGAGWSITFYKWRVSIHAKRMIAGFSLGLGKFYWGNIKSDWALCNMNKEHFIQMQKRIDELKNL